MSKPSIVFIGSVCFQAPCVSGRSTQCTLTIRPMKKNQDVRFMYLEHADGFTEFSTVHETPSTAPTFTPLVVACDTLHASEGDMEATPTGSASKALADARQELLEADGGEEVPSAQVAQISETTGAQERAEFELRLEIEVECFVEDDGHYRGTASAPSLAFFTSHDLVLTLQAVGAGAYETLDMQCAVRLLDLSPMAVRVLCVDDDNGAPHIYGPLMQSARRAPVRLPYGIMPLYTLYDHAVFLTRTLCGPSYANCRASPSVRRLLHQQTSLKGPLCSAVEGHTADASVAYRWDLLREVDCSCVILGDVGFAPVAMILPCCRGVRRLLFPQSNLSFVSAKRLVAAVRAGVSSLEEVYLSGNHFFELGGEELLRLLKGGSGTLCVVDVANNGLSDRLALRFESLAYAAARARSEDPFNAMSSRFDYLVHMDALPSQYWEHVEPVWRMLTVVPPLPPGMTGSPSPGIPVAAAAPLFSEMIRSVCVEIARERQDPAIRAVFGPIGSVAASAPSDEASVFSPPNRFLMSADAVYLHSYVKMLVTTLRVALDAPVHWDDAVHTLRSIGAQHERNGIDAAIYCTANRMLVKAMEAHIPDDALTPNVKAAFIQVLALMTRSTVGGMQHCV